MRKEFLPIARIGILALASGLFACSQVNRAVVDPLIVDLQKINNTAADDLRAAVKIADAATPPDGDGKACALAAIEVSGDINAVLAAGGSTSGPLATAELASLFQPGSIQFNTEKQKLISGCAAKAQDVLGAAGVIVAGGVAGAIAGGQILPFLAAP